MSKITYHANSSNSTISDMKDFEMINGVPFRKWNGRIERNSINVLQVLENDPNFPDGCIGFDSFRRDIYVRSDLPWAECPDKIKGRDWEKIDSMQMRHYINKKYGVNIKLDEVKYAVEIYAEEYPFNPLIEALNNLPTWDGKQRLQNVFIDYFGEEDNEYIRQASEILFRGIVRRMYHAGSLFEFMPIIFGREEADKEAFCKIISQDWYIPEMKTYDHSWQLWQSTRGALICKDSKLAKYKLGMKSFITACEDYVRFNRGYSSSTHIPRTAIIIGTTTKQLDWLPDPDGNRRFVPLNMNRPLDHVRLKQELPQILAEAKALETAEGVFDKAVDKLTPLYFYGKKAGKVWAERLGTKYENSHFDSLDERAV